MNNTDIKVKDAHLSTDQHTGSKYSYVHFKTERKTINYYCKQ